MKALGLYSAHIFVGIRCGSRCILLCCSMFVKLKSNIMIFWCTRSEVWWSPFNWYTKQKTKRHHQCLTDSDDMNSCLWIWTVGYGRMWQSKLWVWMVPPVLFEAMNVFHMCCLKLASLPTYKHWYCPDCRKFPCFEWKKVVKMMWKFSVFKCYNRITYINKCTTNMYYFINIGTEASGDIKQCVRANS